VLQDQTHRGRRQLEEVSLTPSPLLAGTAVTRID
jgi:hypothetical protein